MKFLFHLIPAFFATASLLGQEAQSEVPLVDIRSVDPRIVINLRYATTNNITRKALYPPDMPAFIRPEVAQRLSVAESYLRRFNYNLVIWDAYRPHPAQIALWEASPKNDYVANPNEGAGSLHTWGIAVDASLADRFGQPSRMPTDFDDFTPAAMWKYTGSSEIVRHNLLLLQVAMREAGFYGLRSEWWHFTVQDWQKLLPPDQARRAIEAFSKQLQLQQKL